MKPLFDYVITPVVGLMIGMLAGWMLVLMPQVVHPHYVHVLQSPRGAASALAR
jgi:hypothetical protein